MLVVRCEEHLFSRRNKTLCTNVVSPLYCCWGHLGLHQCFAFFFPTKTRLGLKICIHCAWLASAWQRGSIWDPSTRWFMIFCPPYPAIAANPSWRLWCREIWGTFVKPRGPLESIRGWIWGHVKLSSQGHNFGFLRNQDNCSSHPIHQRQGLFGCGESLNEHCIRQYLRDMVIWPMSACQKD